LLVLDVAVLRLVLAPWQMCASTLSATEVIPARAPRALCEDALRRQMG